MWRLTPSTAATSANRLTRSTSWTSPPAMVRGQNTRAANPLLGRPGTPERRPEIATDTTGVAPARPAVPPLLGAYWTFGQYWGVWVVVFAEYLRAHGFSAGEAG